MTRRKVAFDVEKKTASVGRNNYALKAIKWEGELLGYSITLPGGDPILGPDGVELDLGPVSWWHLDGNFGGTFEMIDDALAIRDAMKSEG